MVKISSIDFREISAQGKDIIDLRPQVMNVYFSFIKEIDVKTKANYEIEDVPSDELWQFDNKSFIESLKEFADRNQKKLDEIYELWQNSSIMLKTEIEIYIADNGTKLLDYDFNNLSNDSGFCFLSADVINPLKEKSFVEKLNGLEKLKSSSKNQKLNGYLKEIYRLQNELFEKHSQISELELEVEDARMMAAYPEFDPNVLELENKKFRLDIDESLLKYILVKTREDIVKFYEKGIAARAKMLSVSNKAKHAIIKKSDRHLKGTYKTKCNVDIGAVLNKLAIKQTAFLVVETINVPVGTELKIKILEKGIDHLITKDQAFSLLDCDSEKTEFIVKVGDYEIEPQKVFNKELDITWNSKYRGYTLDYEHTIDYKSIITENLKKVVDQTGATVPIQKSMIQFSIKSADEKITDEWERKLKEEASNIYLEVNPPNINIAVKGTDKEGLKKGRFFYAKESDDLAFVYEILIKKATDYNYKGKKETSGLCAKWTFNHAHNYVNLLRGNLGAISYDASLAAGGNANDESYHKNLISLGYTQVDKGIISKEDLINELNAGNYGIGDIVVYWAIDESLDANAFNGYKENGNKKYINAHKRFGHTQIFTGGLHTAGQGKFNWATDDQDNFGCNFVYASRQGKSYRYKVFNPPKA